MAVSEITPMFRRDPTGAAERIALMESATPYLSDEERAREMGGTAMTLYRFA